MLHKREYETYERKGVENPRCYYIPFGDNQEFSL